MEGEIASNGVNPTFRLPGRIRNPAVNRNIDFGDQAEGEYYEIFFSHFSDDRYTAAVVYRVRVVTTTDWKRFSEPLDVTPVGYTSPSALVRWHGHVPGIEPSDCTC